MFSSHCVPAPRSFLFIIFIATDHYYLRRIIYIQINKAIYNPKLPSDEKKKEILKFTDGR